MLAMTAWLALAGCAADRLPGQEVAPQGCQGFGCGQSEGDAGEDAQAQDTGDAPEVGEGLPDTDIEDEAPSDVGQEPPEDVVEDAAADVVDDVGADVVDDVAADVVEDAVEDTALDVAEDVVEEPVDPCDVNVCAEPCPGGCDCQGTCRNRDAQASCEPGSSCDLTFADGRNISAFCGANAECTFTCDGVDQCRTRCDRNSRCTIVCRDVARGDFFCDEGAECVVRLEGNSSFGSFICADTSEDCGGGVSVCARPCP